MQMWRWKWLFAAVGAAVAVGAAFVLGHASHAQLAAGRHPQQATRARGRSSASIHGSKAVDCEIVSAAYVKGIVLVDRACVRSSSITLEYMVSGTHIKNTIRALAAACDTYVGTAADHQWVGTYVVPTVRRQLRSAGGHCRYWLDLASRQPPAGPVQMHARSAALYSGS